MPRSPLHVHQNLRVTCCHHLKVSIETMRTEAIYQPETPFTTCQNDWGRHNSKYSNMNEHFEEKSSVYDCTVEDVEHVVIALTGAHMQPACVTELTSSEY